MDNFNVKEAQIKDETLYGVYNENGERVSTRYTTYGVRRDLEDLEYEAKQNEEYRAKDLEDLARIKAEIAESVFKESLAEYEAMEEDRRLKEIADKKFGIIHASSFSNEEMDMLLNEVAEKEGRVRLDGTFLESPDEARERLAKELTGKITVADFSNLSDEEKENDPLYNFSVYLEEREKEEEHEKEDEGELSGDILE